MLQIRYLIMLNHKFFEYFSAVATRASTEKSKSVSSQILSVGMLNMFYKEVTYSCEERVKFIFVLYFEHETYCGSSVNSTARPVGTYVLWND